MRRAEHRRQKKERRKRGGLDLNHCARKGEEKKREGQVRKEKA